MVGDEAASLHRDHTLRERLRHIRLDVAIDEFEAPEINALMTTRKAALEDRRTRLLAVERSAPSGLLARREAALLDAEISWIALEMAPRDHPS